MKRKFSKPAGLYGLHLFLILLFVSLLGRGAAAFEVTRTEYRSFFCSPGSVLDLSIVSGEIRILPGEKDSIELEIKSWASANTERRARQLLEKLTLDFHFSPKELVIKQLQRGGGGLFSSLLRSTGLQSEPKMKFYVTIQIPKSVNVKLSLHSGRIELQNISGNVAIDLKSGKLVLDGIESDQATLKLGDVWAQVETMRGLSGESAACVVSAQKGVVYIRECELNRLVVRLQEADGFFVKNRCSEADIESSSGDLYWNGFGEALHSVRLVSDRGDIHCFFPKHPAVAIQAETQLGRFIGSADWDPEKRGGGFALKRIAPSPCEFLISSVLGDIYFEEIWK